MEKIVSKRVGLQKFSNRIAPILSLVLALFGWYKFYIGTPGSFYLVLAIVFTIAFVVSLVMKGQSANLSLYEGESLIKDYRAVSWSASAILTRQWSWTKNVALTNKRIVLSSNFFGVETYKGAMSVFYNENDFQQNKSVTSCLLKDVRLEDDAVLIVLRAVTLPTDITWKLKEDKDFIYKTILENRKA